MAETLKQTPSKPTKESVLAYKAQLEADLELYEQLFGRRERSVAVPTEALYGSDPYVGLLGKGVYIRQATYHLVGKLASVGQHELVLEGASTVFDTGDLAAFLKSGKATVVEPMGRVIVARGAIIDCCECKV